MWSPERLHSFTKLKYANNIPIGAYEQAMKRRSMTTSIGFNAAGLMSEATISRGFHDVVSRCL
jgi:hypothetical protein